MRQFSSIFRRYPIQFWLLIFGLVVSTTGTTMVWPFLTIYASETLSLPMAAVTSLMTFNSISGLIASILAGTLVDYFGRKSIMVFGVFGMALVYLSYIFANEFWQFGLLMFLSGSFSPLYRIGTDAIVADMLPAEERAQAYGFLRMGRNIGVALGPILGGIVLSSSYNIGFVSAALALATYGIITLLFLKETLERKTGEKRESLGDQFRVMHQAMRNKAFMRMLGSFTLMEICATLMWVILAVYIKQNFGIQEDQYSWIPTTNALMVIFLQVGITRLTSRHDPHRVMPIGAAFYPLAMLIVAYSTNFWGFLLAMVVMTFGELITAPTATAYVANLAPADQRGRYLGFFGLNWFIALSIGPMGAGILTDKFSIQTPWFVGAVVGVLSVLAFWSLRQIGKAPEATQEIS
ncbi:MAG: MDR family MFS transporter [Anaerolineaceae bacterium]|jgi:MFS family permease